MGVSSTCVDCNRALDRVPVFCGIGSIANSSGIGGVAYMAHIGGFTSGFVLTRLFRENSTQRLTR